MAFVRVVVDHMKLEYSGLFDSKELFKHIASFANNNSLQKRDTKSFEQDLPEGKCIETESDYWRKVTDYARTTYRIRILIHNLKKVEAMLDKKKKNLSSGKVVIWFDAFLEQDYEHRWEDVPMLLFIRTLFDKWLYHGYTERFEQRITHLTNHWYDQTEKFFNFYRHYKTVSKIPHFAH
jgi:hypothetical protein